MRQTVKRSLAAAAALGAFALASPARASSHREALAILNEPCADNTDVYAWVSPGAHDKLYLIANVLPLHEPGQGNQGLRACSGYRYEFHVGKGRRIADDVVYRVEFGVTAPKAEAPSPTDPPRGGNELLWQITGGAETYRVTRIDGRTGRATILGRGLAVAPNDHGPQTDRFVYGLGPFAGYDSGNPESRTVGLYESMGFGETFVQALSNGGRAFAGQRDDPYYLDEKGIFDLVNLCADGLFGIAGARTTDCEDVFTGFNLFTIALEIPTSDLFPNGIPHNGVLDPTSTDSLLRVWVTESKRAIQIADSRNAVTGYRGAGPWVQVGREAHPLFNAGIVGTARQNLYLRSHPRRDVSNFGADILFPVLVRDADLLGIYAALGIDPDAAGLKGPRVDIINTLNLGRPIPIANGFSGDVITIDAATDSQYPNGRSLQVAPGAPMNKEPVDVSDVLISLIVAGNPAAGAGDGVNSNDKNYLPTFPFVASPHQGLLGGHGGTNQ